MKNAALSGSLRRAAAILAIGSLAACGGGSTTPQPPASGGNVTGGGASGTITARIVGVGDSLTAGVQSAALLGQDVVPNPLGGPPLTFPIVPNTQGHGYYARVWSQANGGANPLDPNITPLPLIKAPGMGSILLPDPKNPGGLTSIQAPCGPITSLGYSFATAQSTRINPGSSPLDVAVPGQTLHSALYQFQSSGPCDGSSLPAPFNSFNALIASENGNFFPILGSFGTGTTQVQAATRLHPTLALVWLGSNDLLKYIFSGGAFGPTTPASFRADIGQVITTLQQSGAKVVVANIFPTNGIAYFTPISSLQALFLASGVPPAYAPALAAGTQQYFQTVFGIGQSGFLTLPGLPKLQGALTAVLTQGATLPAALAAAGFVQADFVPDALANSATQLDSEYNAAIADAVKSSGAVLVDTNAYLSQIVAQGGIPISASPACCNTFYQGGLYSLDGIHPSDTFYALLANLFIQAADQAYNAGIPPLTQAQIQAIHATDLYAPH